MQRGDQLGDAVGAGLVVGVEEDDHLLVDDGERVLEVVRLAAAAAHVVRLHAHAVELAQRVELRLEM